MFLRSRITFVASTVKLYRTPQNPHRTPTEPLQNPHRTPTEPYKTPTEPLQNPHRTPTKPLQNPYRTPTEPTQTPKKSYHYRTQKGEKGSGMNAKMYTFFRENMKTRPSAVKQNIHYRARIDLPNVLLKETKLKTM